MKPPSRLGLALFLVGLALAVPRLSAASGTSGSTSATASAAEVNPQHFTLEIRKGQIMEGDKQIGTASVGGILDYLRKKNYDFTIALGPGVADVVVGDMILNMDTFGNYAVGQAIAISASEPLVFNTDFPALVLKDQQQRQVAVFNLSAYLNPNGDADDKSIRTKLDSLTQIILHTLEDVNPIDPGGKRLSFQFHAGANLLVVTGTEQAIKVAGQVVNALNPQRPLPMYANVANAWANGDPAATLQWAQSLPESSLNDAQMQAIMNALKRAGEQNSQTSEQAKQAQQRAAEIQKLVQEWANSDPAAETQWIQSLPKPPPPPPPGPVFSQPAGSAK